MRQGVRLHAPRSTGRRKVSLGTIGLLFAALVLAAIASATSGVRAAGEPTGGASVAAAAPAAFGGDVSLTARLKPARAAAADADLPDFSVPPSGDALEPAGRPLRATRPAAAFATASLRDLTARGPPPVFPAG